MVKSLKTRVQHKHDTEENWQRAVTFVPLAGEIIIYDADDVNTTPRIKIGDGVYNPETGKVEGTLVNDLGFTVSGGNGIMTGEADPDAETTGQFYFKYSAN